MRAAYYAQTGVAADVLTLGELPDPEPQAGEVLVRVAASGVNPADVKRRAGWGGMAMAHPRVIPHSDGAGTIERVGHGVSPERIGERVWLWNAQGGYGTAGRANGTAAEFIALPTEQAVALPEHYSMEQGACLGVPAMTAHRCVMADGPVRGSILLIQGGGGAVGFLAVQIALASGARVLTTVGADRAAAHLRTVGATSVNRKCEDVTDRILELTDGRGVDRIIEVDFAANQTTDATLLRPNGTIASFSSSSDPYPTLDYYALAAKGANVRFIQGFTLSVPARQAAQSWIAAQRLDIPIATVHPLANIAEAHSAVEAGDNFGQVVVSLDRS